MSSGLRCLMTSRRPLDIYLYRVHLCTLHVGKFCSLNFTCTLFSHKTVVSRANRMVQAEMSAFAFLSPVYPNLGKLHEKPS